MGEEGSCLMTAAEECDLGCGSGVQISCYMELSIIVLH